MIGELPPAGNRISTDIRLPLPEFRGYRPIWLASGTAALALAMLHIKRQRSDVTQPEIILPAYACPDLVSAAVYAGLRPVLCDIGSEDPGLNLAQLEEAASENTVAAIAVNFLGIQERIDSIRSHLPASTAIIEDNAQCFPESVDCLKGEYVVASFGRGKPASTLGGGLLLVNDDLPLFPDWLYRNVKPAADSIGNWAGHRGKVHLYNLLRHPRLYCWLRRMPFVSLGDTRYKALADIQAMPESCKSLVASNTASYLGFDRWREKQYRDLLSEFRSVRCLSSQAAERCGRLLRFPLLCGSAAERDELLAELSAKGLGASAMYQKPLAAIPGVADKVRRRNHAPGAARFAERLLTLPLHSGVTQRHIADIAAVFRGQLARKGESGAVEMGSL
ncbi:hypothetical protein F6455_00645 [Proteobacteria bacterium 005FR1]|nr:hypothetical protein [Proteobacteria bacterium 005FR1]